MHRKLRNIDTVCDSVQCFFWLFNRAIKSRDILPANLAYYRLAPHQQSINIRSRVPLAWAPAGFFSMGGQRGVWRTEVPQQGPGAAPRWSLGRSWHFLKMMHKYFVYWGFRQHLQQKHFSTFLGGQVPPYPCLRASAPPWEQCRSDSLETRTLFIIGKLLVDFVLVIITSFR